MLNVASLGFRFWVIIGLCFTITLSCNQETEEPGCGCLGSPQFKIENENATTFFDSLYSEWVIQGNDGSILSSCSDYPDSLKIDKLPIIWSGYIMGVCPNQNVRSRRVNFTEITKL